MQRWSIDLKPLAITLAAGFGLLAILASVGCWNTQSRPPVVGPGPGPANPARTWTLQIDVTTSEGVPLEGASVRVYTTDPAVNVATGVTDGAGHHFWLSLPQAGYSACAAKLPEYPEVCVAVNLVESRDGNNPARIVLARLKPKPTLSGRLRPSGRSWVTDAGPFRWRGATSFGLVHLVATGREDVAVARMRELASEGVTLVRVLTMARFLFPLSPEQGQAALARTLALARAEGLYVEVVALADTESYPAAAMVPHLNAVARIAHEAGNAVLEGANEIGPVHDTQRPEVVSLVRRFVPPAGLPYVPGSVHGSQKCTDESLMLPGQLKVWREKKQPPYWDEIAAYAGHYGTSHLKRDGDFANRHRRVRELELNSEAKGIPFVDDEPIGFAEAAIRDKRDTNEHAAYLQGVLSPVMDIGSTFHSEAGLRSDPLGPLQLAALRAFIAGTRVVPNTVRLDFQNTGWPTSPVADALFVDEGGSVVRVYSGVSGNTGITVALGLTGDPQIRWQNGWSPRRVIAERPGVTVWEIGK